MKITIGREGDQPFTIPKTALGVSRHHAEIEIEGDAWTLRNLDAANYTYIRQDNGSLRAIEQKRITPDTFIVLNSTTAYGHSFYARQVFKRDNYRREFTTIEKEYDEAQRRKSRIKTWTKVSRVVVPVLLIILSIVLRNNGTAAVGLLALSGVCIFLIQELGKKREAAIDERLKPRLACPACGRLLDAAAIHRHQCPKCQAM